MVALRCGAWGGKVACMWGHHVMHEGNTVVCSVSHGSVLETKQCVFSALGKASSIKE